MNSLPPSGIAHRDPVVDRPRTRARRETRPSRDVANCRDQLVPSSVRKICACPFSAGPALIDPRERCIASRRWRESRAPRRRGWCRSSTSRRRRSCARRGRACRSPTPPRRSWRTVRETRRSSRSVAESTVRRARWRPTAEDADDAVRGINRSSRMSAPPERGGDDAVQADQRHALDPDRLAVVDDDRRRQRREQQRGDEQRRQHQRQHRRRRTRRTTARGPEPRPSAMSSELLRITLIA